MTAVVRPLYLEAVRYRARPGVRVYPFPPNLTSSPVSHSQKGRLWTKHPRYPMDSHRSSLRVVSRRSASEDEALLKPLLLWGFNPAY